MQGEPIDMNDPAGLLNNSVTSSSDPLGLNLNIK